MCDHARGFSGTSNIYPCQIVDMDFKHPTCDIFCAVVDNYGDIGVSWRLAKQLANEHEMDVRLWVDDLASFAKLCPEVDVALDEQRCRGVEVRRWGGGGLNKNPLPQPLSRRRERVADRSGEGVDEEDASLDLTPVDLVIEAFACKLPEPYVEAMAALKQKPVWFNLEYLSAESWVEGAHKLPSPHLRLPLDKYFFFPGFTEKTGGLLIERELLNRRDVFQADLATQQAYWRSMGLPERVAGELRVSLFSYENDALEAMLRTWERSEVPIVCCVPEGRVLPSIREYFAGTTEPYARGNLKVYVLPFVEQERYDELLWACDINFVRGEDSCVRAQWAGKPFVWHIYPQHDGVHMQKLRALSALYAQDLTPETSQGNAAMWLAWNGEGEIEGAWQAFVAQRSELQAHALAWSAKLANNNLALNLLDFYRQVGRIRAFEN